MPNKVKYYIVKPENKEYGQFLVSTVGKTKGETFEVENVINRGNFYKFKKSDLLKITSKEAHWIYDENEVLGVPKSVQETYVKYLEWKWKNDSDEYFSRHKVRKAILLSSYYNEHPKKYYGF